MVKKKRRRRNLRRLLKLMLSFLTSEDAIVSATLESLLPLPLPSVITVCHFLFSFLFLFPLSSTTISDCPCFSLFPFPFFLSLPQNSPTPRWSPHHVSSSFFSLFFFSLEESCRTKFLWKDMLISSYLISLYYFMFLGISWCIKFLSIR